MEGCRIIERQIEGQNVDARFTDYTEPPAAGVLAHHLRNLILAQTTRFGDPGDLNLGRGRADLGV